MSIKDRAAILPAGHTADGAYWFDSRVRKLRQQHLLFRDAAAMGSGHQRSTIPVDAFASNEWLLHKMPSRGSALSADMEATPYGNELIQQFALRALAAEKLGTTTAKTDLLTVSYSANDYVGHRYGPDSPKRSTTSRCRVD